MLSVSSSPRLVLWLQSSSYFSSSLLSLCSCVSLALNQEQFRGHCLLFSSGQWRESDGQLEVSWASQLYCNAAMLVSLVTFLVSVSQFFRLGRLVLRCQDVSFLAAFLDVLLSAGLCVAVTSVAVLLTFGYRAWCGLMTERFDTCDNAADNDIDRQDAIDASNFPLHMGIAQLGLWSSFVCLVTALVFSMLKLCRYHYEENLRVSMARERKRLINDDNDNLRQVSNVHSAHNQDEHGVVGSGQVVHVEQHQPPPDLLNWDS